MMESPHPPFPSRLARRRAERAARAAAADAAEQDAPLALESADLPSVVPPPPEPAGSTPLPPPEPADPTPTLPPPPAGQQGTTTRTGVITGVVLPGMAPRGQVTNRNDAPPPPSPVRRSFKERMASAHSSLADSVLTSATGSPIMQTNVSLIGLSTTQEPAFQIAADGEITSAEAAVPIAAAIEVSEPAGVIDMQEALGHHLFLVSEAVDPAELEALAISMWDDAGWLAPGRLHLSSDAELEGPWSLDQPTRAQLGTPSLLTHAWILRCPVSRAEEKPSAVMGEWAQAFPDGMPVGLEYRVLEALGRMARRLAGGLRLAGSGYVMLSAMRERAGFEQMKDARDIVPEAPALTPAQAAQIEKLKAELGPVREDIASKIAKAREELEAQRNEPQVVDGYALMCPIGHHSDMMVEVHAVPSPPRVLRWEPWTAGAIIEYQVRWLSGLAPTPGTNTMSRTARRERLRSAQEVEKAAGLIATLVGGNVIDEDGFLVGLADVSDEDEE